MLDVVVDRLDEPTSRGLADAVSAAIRDGALVEGALLPPIRTVAEQLKISPTTVSAAWALLARAGAIHTDGRRGTRIAAAGRGPNRYRRALRSRTTFELDLSTGVCDPALLPDIGPALRDLRATATPGSYLDDPVLAELDQALRADWPYEPERITVVDGAMDALDLIGQNLLRFGDKVVVEHPCFPPLLDLLEALGMKAIGVALDAEGMVTEQLRTALAAGARAVFLQPRAQNPTGVSMSDARAAELAGLLSSAAEVLIVEDDSAGAIASAPAITMARWLPERTLHIRSFSKSHGPDLRLAAVSGPSALLDRITERRLLGQGWTSRLLQSLLVRLLTEPAALRQVEDAREQYALRRNEITSALREFGVEVLATDGINIWLPVHDESAALVRLASRGIGAAAGGPFAATPNQQPHIRVTVGLVAERRREVAAELAEAAQLGAWSSPR